ncbi:MAG: GspE/PulE family protein, partial [bacterium]
MQSIEDLTKTSQNGEGEDESATGKFKKKEDQIRIKDEERSAEARATDMSLPYVNLFGFPISPEALKLIDEKEAKELQAVCFFYDGEHIRIAAVHPEDEKVKKRLNEICKEYFSEGGLYLVSQHSMEYSLRLYRTLPKIRKFVRGVSIEEKDLNKFEKEITDYKSLGEKINEVNITDVITLILATAIKTGASDIHIEAEENGIVVRFRIDGILQEAAEIKKESWKKIISRIKMLAKVKINVEGQPQDGRFSIHLKKERIDVRVSFFPTNYGESVAMRLLFSGAAGLPFEDLGLLPEVEEVLKKEIKKPNGLILSAGPTGSGKTTTLYAILKKLNQPGMKIITLENPIEYQLEGVSQSQIDLKKDYTFAKGLRSLLRQDPDIVMVGEIRDLETAEISIQASITGHLVLSTLHTNDAAGVIPRLIDLGVKPYFLTPAINAVIGQRLVRKLCPECRTEHKLTEAEEEQVKKILAVLSPKAGLKVPNELPKIYKAGQGCANCSGLGYKGRIGIYEVFIMNDNIKELTAQKAQAFKILQQAIENGMVTMLQDGILKVLKGMTSLDEVYRVIGKFDYIDSLYDMAMASSIGRGIKITEKETQEAQKFSGKLNEIGGSIAKMQPNEMLPVILALAVKVEAGDIHIEPTENEVKIRFRIDGILHDIVDIPKDHYIQILSKIKILAGFPTNVKKATMDGRFSIKINNSNIDCRISIISGGYGETIVIRVLANQASALAMAQLGITGRALESIERSMKKTKGVIITTGPTGSGKTTTLYSILNKLNKSDIKIMTIEDPIEYHMDGVMQTQIDNEQGYTFAAALRSFMRQNPNIIMVGEIRDPETAKTAIEAAMTGHLVLSTIHANGAAGAIARFAGLSVDRQMLAASIESSIGQRLVRKICPHCKKEVKLNASETKEVKEVLATIDEKISGVKIPKELKFYKGAGCEKCNGLGYKGRLGIYEVIEMTPDIQKIIQSSGVTDFEIEQAAMKNGAILMLQDGVLKALAGETTIEEV